MFSEYASKFLAQSQSRLGAIREGRTPSSAPLFHSAADYLPEDPEHEEERNDLWALQSSRRHFGAYAPSENGDEDDAEFSEEDSTHSLRRSAGRRQEKGFLKSSWRPRERSQRLHGSRDSAFSELTERGAPNEDKGKDKMEDVELSASHEETDSELEHIPPHDLTRQESETDDEMRNPPEDLRISMPDDDDQHYPHWKRKGFDSPDPGLAFARPEDEERAGFLQREPSPRRTPARTQVPQQVYHPTLDPPTHDRIWGTIYLVCMASMFTTSFVVWLHTTEMSNVPFKDNIYNTLHKSIHLLTIDTLLAIGVSLLWLYLLRRFVKPLIYVLLVSVPVVMTILSIYPLVMSFKMGEREGGDKQHTAMRWGSIVPAVIAVSWVWMAWSGRNAMTRAVGIIQLACKILGENPALVLLSFGTLVATCLFTWMWVGMFTRAFLTGNALRGGLWVWHLDTSTALLGIYYILILLWTLGVSSGIHRATSAATVSQWYFHRHLIPTPSSQAIMNAAIHHSTTTLFGTICLSALIALLVRLPLLVAPRRIAAIIHLFFFQFLSSPIAAITNPLTLTYSAIHSQPLGASSRAVANLRFIDAAGQRGDPKTAYRMAKMLLSATRGITAASMGIGAWIAVMRQGPGSGGESVGGLYGYLVGLIAGCIGWVILSATEGGLSNIVDAVLVCVGSEGEGQSHCREAQAAFGGA